MQDSVLFELKKRLKTSYPTKTDAWFRNLPKKITNLIILWELNELVYLDGASLGVIIKANSKKLNSKVIVKIIPDFINRYYQEKNAYISLSHSYMCRLLDYCDDEMALLLELIVPGGGFDYKEDRQKLFKFFNQVYCETINSCESTIYSYFTLYREKLILSNFDSYEKERRIIYHERSEKLINRFFCEEPCYLMHGDLHNGNVLRNNNGFKAIDPLGFSAPKEFVFMRFFLFELLFSFERKAVMEDRLMFLKNFIEDPIKFYAAILIDTDLCIETGIVQLNDNYRTVNQFLSLMEFFLTDLPFEEFI